MGSQGSNQLVIPKSTFGQATSMDRKFEEDTAYDGYLGLAFQADNQNQAADNAVPVLVNAINQHLLDQPVFMVALFDEGNQTNVPGS